jgi:hypothetical protein
MKECRALATSCSSGHTRRDHSVERDQMPRLHTSKLSSMYVATAPSVARHAQAVKVPPPCCSPQASQPLSASRPRAGSGACAGNRSRPPFREHGGTRLVHDLVHLGCGASDRRHLQAVPLDHQAQLPLEFRVTGHGRRRDLDPFVMPYLNSAALLVTYSRLSARAHHDLRARKYVLTPGSS